MSILNAEWFHDLTNEKRAHAASPAELPKSRRSGWKPAGYLPDPGLADALRVALILRKPLLLTGEPGTGKTECAAYLAWKLGYGDPLAFEAKSVSEAKDLFYTYDALGRFHAKEEGKPAPDARSFIHFNALGEAILRTLDGEAVADVVPAGWQHGAPRQSVVLIDEIDKAPRDFPNDLLNEVDRLYFRIAELGNRMKRAAEGLEPVLVITSNSEKNLPPAFLRRCVYYHIPFPKERLETIVASRMPELASGASAMVQEAIAFFLFLRESSAGLEKRPATAELLDWIAFLQARGIDSGRGLKAQGGSVPSSLVTLLKHERDQSRSVELWEAWRKG